MKIYQPLPADGRQVVWNRWDDTEFESIDVRWDNEAWTIAAKLPQQRAEYVIRASPFWQPRQFLLFRDLDQPDLWLGTDGNRRWGEVNGAHRPDLDAVTALFVDDSLLSLALPILQLDIEVGDRVELPLAHVDTDTLAVTPTRWRFERVGSHRWAVQRADLQRDDDTAAVAAVDRLPNRYEFDVDEYGLPLDVEDHCRRRPD